jgi:putative transcriptional regulator
MLAAAATMGHTEVPVLINRLSRLVGERRVTVKEVAERTGLSYKVVLDLYHDRSTRLDVATLGKLCDYFLVGPSEIFEWRPPDEERPSAAPPGA